MMVRRLEEGFEHQGYYLAAQGMILHPWEAGGTHLADHRHQVLVMTHHNHQVKGGLQEQGCLMAYYHHPLDCLEMGWDSSQVGVTNVTPDRQ